MVRKPLVFTALLGILCIPEMLYGWVAAPSYARDATGKAYLGMGLGYATRVDIAPKESDDGWVLHLRIGYHFVDWFSLQFDFDQFKTDMKTYMVTARLWDRFDSTRPFISVGLGRIDADDFGTDPCAKFGAGMEYFPYENISFGGEVAYVRGYEGLDHLEYSAVTGAASLYF